MTKTTQVKISADAKSFVEHLLSRGFKNPAIQAIAANCSYKEEKTACIAYASQCRKNGTESELIEIRKQEQTAQKIERSERREAEITFRKEAAKSGKSVDRRTGKTIEKRKICRAKIFNFPVTAVIRAMGAKGWDFTATLIAVTTLGAADISEVTVRLQLSAGRKGQRGTPADLSPSNWKTLKANCK